MQIIAVFHSVLDNCRRFAARGTPKPTFQVPKLTVLCVLVTILLGAPLFGQATGNTTIQPDCLIPFTFTAAGNFPATPTNNGAGDNRTKGCAAWTLMYQNGAGMTGVTVTLQSGSSTTTTVSFGSFAGTISSGYTNGIVSDTGGSLQATNGTADISWVRVNVAATGTGTLTGVLYGFRNSSAAVNGGGGGDCPQGATGEVQAYVSTGVCGGAATTVAALPSAAASTSALFLVSDGATTSDCTVGLGTSYVLCSSNGAAWVAIGGGTGTCAGLAGDVTGTCAANTVTKVENGAIPASAGALGTNAAGQLISVTPGGGTTPGYPANQPVSGCGVEYVSGLVFTVGACTYTIGGTQYTISTVTTVTLATADPSNPRIDVIYVDNTGVAAAITGTPAGTPAQPTVDYSTQLPLNLVLVPAGSSTPGGISTTLIYDENVEWTSTCSAHLNCASTNNPYSGTKDIEATAAVLGNSVTLVKPAAGTVNLSTQNTLIFYIRSKAKWPSGSGTGSSGLRTLSLFWKNGATAVGLQVVLKDGAFGFSSSNTTTYQQIAIPISLFGTGSNLVTTLVAQVSGNGGTSSFGWYMDEVTLQAGQAPLSLPATLMNFKGTWNSTANYNVNDLVVSSGIYYTALAANTNVAVTTTATWAAGFPAAIPNGTTATTQSQNDNSTKPATTAYTDLAVSNALAGTNPAVAVLAASTGVLTGTYANGASGVGATFTVTATGTFSLDGVAINTIGQRVLLKDQSSAFQNGVYVATVVGAVAVSPVFTRASDYNTPSNINSTGAIPIQSGTVNGPTGTVAGFASALLTSTVTTVGTDALTYVKFSLTPNNIVVASSPGAGIAHFAGSTQTATSSKIVAGDITSTITSPAPGSSCTFVSPSTVCVCTTTCTITVPVPTLGDQYCVMNDDNVSTVITLSAIGSSGQYENQARTAYGTATTGTLVSGGAVKDFVCILGRDSTHYLFASGGGTWTAN